MTKGANVPVARRGPERKLTRANVVTLTFRMDPPLFEEFSEAIDLLKGQDGRAMTQREFLEGAIRREIRRRRPQLQRARAANRKGLTDASENATET